jgi:hypothetical protein
MIISVDPITFGATNLGEFGKRRSVRCGWGIGFHQLSEKREISRRAHPVYLVAHGSFHVY